MSDIPENAATGEVTTPSVEPSPAKKPRVAAQARHVATSKRKPGKQAARAKKANDGAKSAKSRKKVADGAQESKTVKVLDLLKRSSGATSADLMKATGWQAHSVRGFISGVLGRKMGLKITSTKVEDGDRRYSLKS